MFEIDYLSRILGKTSKNTDGRQGAMAVVQIGGKKYDSAEFSIPTGTSKYSLNTDSDSYKTSGNVFNNIDKAYFTEVRTDTDITIRFNEDDNDPISLDANESVMDTPHIEVNDIYITNASGDTATVKIRLA